MLSCTRSLLTQVNVVDGRVDRTNASKAFKAWCEGRKQHEFTGPQHSFQKFGSRTVPRSYMDEDSLKEVHGDEFAQVRYWEHDVDPVKKNVFKENVKAFRAKHGWSFTCKRAECASCGLPAKVAGTFKWKGTGLYEYLEGDTRDPPFLNRRASEASYQKRHAASDFFECSNYYDGGSMMVLPRPPDGWKELPIEKTDNGGELPGAAAPGTAGSSSGSAGRARARARVP